MAADRAAIEQGHRHKSDSPATVEVQLVRVRGTIPCGVGLKADSKPWSTLQTHQVNLHVVSRDTTFTVLTDSLGIVRLTGSAGDSARVWVNRAGLGCWPESLTVVFRADRLGRYELTQQCHQALYY